MNPSVASITIAYNSATTLPRQLDTLLSQTRTLQEIIVVDNASSDETAKMLSDRYPQVTLLRMPANLGAAGAWSAGLRYAALERGHHWVWTFDDDSVPEPSALESMLVGLKHASAQPNSPVGIVVPMPVHRNVSANYAPIFWSEGFVRASVEEIQQPIWFADAAIASGALVSREVVETVGVPRDDFFMDVFDFEYCLRARSSGYRLAVVTAARLFHEVGLTKQVKLFGHSRFWMDQPPWREYYISRNLSYLAWHVQPTARTKRYMLRYLSRHLVGTLLFSSHRFRCAWRIVQGFTDGHRGSLGIRFMPASSSTKIAPNFKSSSAD